MSVLRLMTHTSVVSTHKEKEHDNEPSPPLLKIDLNQIQFKF